MVIKRQKAGGEGKKKKVFSESLGVDHLVQLSNQIASSHADALQKRVDKVKEKQAWQKGRRRNEEPKIAATSDGEEKQEGGGDRTDGHAEFTTAKTMERKPKKMLTKSSIRAGLIAQQREKAKRRKETRKAAERVPREGKKAREDSKDSKATATASGQRKEKRVSFA